MNEREHLTLTTALPPLGQERGGDYPDRHPADLGKVPIRNTVALREAPEFNQVAETNPEQQESERKKVTAENIRVLTKRFGERFVKSERMEGGGYTGDAARELLAGFMDRSDFSQKLKRFIPNRQGALRLLKDNHAYILATLEGMYKDDQTYERSPFKDPYELARSVGYELTGPFTSTSEFVPYKAQDYRPGEDICTFNAPNERLWQYHILWLRREDIKDIAPADQLSQNNLSDTWKAYLKTIGRYDRDTGSYDLTELRPSRDDPYGTSSMSVQVSRRGSHVSIKNRYNHTVGNPDNTLDSNLDNVAYGLKRAVYARVGREDLMRKTNVPIAEGYTADNKGGIHRYSYEEGNVYYGDYEYIENGVVTSIDRGQYVMISPQVYAPRNRNGGELSLRPAQTNDTGRTVGEDVKFLYEYRREIEDKEDLSPIDQLRKEYAERDHVEIAEQTREALMAQARAAYDVYRNVARQPGANEIMTEAAFAGLLERKEAEWRENGVIDHLVYEFIEKGSLPNLVATPNVLADWEQI